MIYDYDSLASFRIQKQSILLDCHSEMKRIHKVFYEKNIMIDIIPHTMDIFKYEVVILPFMIIWKDIITLSLPLPIKWAINRHQSIQKP